MNEMTYVIRFEENLNLGDTEFYLKEIKSPIRLEIGDKIAINHASFDRFNDLSKNDIDGMMEILLKKSIIASKHRAYFEISDIVYNHEWYDDEEESNFHGTIILKGKQNETNRNKNANS